MKFLSFIFALFVYVAALGAEAEILGFPITAPIVVDDYDCGE